MGPWKTDGGPGHHPLTERYGCQVLGVCVCARAWRLLPTTHVARPMQHDAVGWGLAAVASASASASPIAGPPIHATAMCNLRTAMGSGRTGAVPPAKATLSAIPIPIHCGSLWPLLLAAAVPPVVCSSSGLCCTRSHRRTAAQTQSAARLLRDNQPAGGLSRDGTEPSTPTPTRTTPPDRTGPDRTGPRV